MKTRIIGAIVALVIAVVGAFVLINYVRGADARAAEGAELSEVYLVQEEIPKGTPGEAVGEYVEIGTVPRRNLVEGYVSDLSELEGLTAVSDVLPGEQLVSARFVSPDELAATGDVPVPAGMQLISFTLPADRVVGGQVRSGDRIGLVGTVDPDEPGEEADVVNPVTSFAFHGVLVAKVQGVVVPDPDTGEAADQGATDSIMVTIALSAHDIERWVWFTEGEAGDYAQIWLTLENGQTDNGGTSPVDGSSAFG